MRPPEGTALAYAQGEPAIAGAISSQAGAAVLPWGMLVPLASAVCPVPDVTGEIVMAHRRNPAPPERCFNPAHGPECGRSPKTIRRGNRWRAAAVVAASWVDDPRDGYLKLQPPAGRPQPAGCFLTYCRLRIKNHRAGLGIMNWRRRFAAAQQASPGPWPLRLSSYRASDLHLSPNCHLS
jgi:hypothetical protein